MKALGIVRKMDELGRIVVPIEVRRVQGWEVGEPVEMFVSGDSLVIKSYNGEKDKQEAIQTLLSLQLSNDDKELREGLNKVIKHLKGVS